MLKIHGHPMSTCTRKVLTTVTELGIPYELDVVDFAKGEHKSEAHVARQPFGRMPAITDDGFELFESRAICRYLNEKAGGALAPTDLQARAKMEQWISIETSEFSGHAMKFIYEYVFRRKQDDGVLETATKALDVTLGYMDKTLTNQLTLTGDQFTLADIGFMPYVEYAMNTPAKETFAKYPAFMSWWGRVSERPSWQKVARNK